MNGPDDRIRTCGILLPKQALYQTEPHPDNVHAVLYTGNWENAIIKNRKEERTKEKTKTLNSNLSVSLIRSTGQSLPCAKGGGFCVAKDGGIH